MASDYSYDEQGQFFPFFILTLSGLVTVPLTWTLISPAAARVKASAAAQASRRPGTGFRPEHADHLDALRADRKRRQRRVKRTLFVVAGWAVMGLMMYLIAVTQRTTPKLWNPYTIMGISDSASEPEIKKRYKELSRLFHPDKIKPDPAKNETLESLNEFYVEISKAYKALTDEEVRNNFIQYGHPDGKQSFSIGIALPKYLVSGGNGKYVVIIYTLLLGVLMPYMVGKWWYGSQRMSKDGVLIESANRLFTEYREDATVGAVITALSAGRELEEALSRGGSAAAASGEEEEITAIEARLLRASAEPAEMPFASDQSHDRDRDALLDLDGGARRKALALLWAYLGRVELASPALDRAKFRTAPITRSLLRSFTTIALAYGHTAPILAAYQAGQHLIQAMLPGSSSPLLQLPHFTAAIARAVEGSDGAASGLSVAPAVSKSRPHLSIQKFMGLPESHRRDLLVKSGLLSESQYDEAVAVARQLPLFCVIKTFFKVPGERVIIPSSLITLVVKGRFVPPGTAPQHVPAITEADVEDIDPAEDDLEAITGRHRKKNPPVAPPPAFAPRYPEDHAPTWYVFLTDSKQGRIAVAPFPHSTFEHPSFDADGRPTFAVQTLKAQFAAPPQPGSYTFAMHVVCDSYVGLDTKVETTLVVEEASKAAAMEDEDDISEPDEDSLAGQMSALKGGGVAAAAAAAAAAGASKPKRKPQQVIEDSDESATEEEYDDTSATNTDTEDEAEIKKKSEKGKKA